MLDKLREAEQTYIKTEEMLSSPEVCADMDKYAQLMKTYKSMTPVIEKYREYKKTESDVNDATELLETSDDPEYKKFAEEELYSGKEKMQRLLDELRIMLLPRDPNDDKNVIIEIRQGIGGEEAALFAYVLFRMYSMYAERQHFKLSVMNVNETGLGGYKEIVFMVEGDGAYSRFKFESGTHRVQRVPETESQGRIHTSTATVAVLPEAEEVEIEIRPEDIFFESCKSTGAGGQHINKTESAVRLTHIPTGIVIECQNERSQFQNKDKALKMLRAKLYEIKQNEQDEMIATTRKNQVGTGDRSEKIRTYNYPQSRITDHRIGYTIHSMENFLNGDIGEMIDALIAADTAEKLKGSVTQ